MANRFSTCSSGVVIAAALVLLPQSTAASEVLTEESVAQSNLEYVSNVLSGNIESIQYRYTEDAILIGHGGMLLQGREALNSHYLKALIVLPKSAKVTTLSLEQAGDKYIELGESRGVTASGGTWFGHYMSIWVEEDGQWLIEKNIYN